MPGAEPDNGLGPGGVLGARTTVLLYVGFRVEELESLVFLRGHRVAGF